MVKKRGFKLITICIVIGCAWWGCKQKGNNSISNTNLITIERFDKELPLFISESIKDSALFIKKYHDFLPIYCYGILNLMPNSPEDSIYNRNGLNDFFSNPAIKKLYEDTESEFQKVHDIELELTKALTLYKGLLGQSYIPRILAHVSGLNQSIITTDSLVSISLDHYLGASYTGYQNIYYPYQLPMKERNRISIDVMQVILYTQYPQNENSKTLLDQMVYEGSIIYALQQIFPQKDIQEIIGYTSDDIDWCKKNEKAIWDKIIRQKHLFSTDLLLKSKYVEPAPFTSPISSEAPGRIGRWMGWRIVSEYMKKEKLSLPQLLEYSGNGEQILKISRYKGS